MNIVIDMNLSPDWVGVLREAGFAAVHWSSVGSPRATDREILAWAKERAHVVFTHDLDFGAILAATGAEAPSVIQMRTQEITPTRAKGVLIGALSRFGAQLEQGAIISLDEGSARARILPIP